MTDTEPLDLEAIEAGLNLFAPPLRLISDTNALIAEVRRLREVEVTREQAIKWQYGVRRKGSHVVGYEFTREGAISLCAEMHDGREPVRRSREGEWEAFA